MVQPELLQRGLGVAHQLLEGVLRILGLLEAHQLHLVELVLADEAPGVLAVASRLAAEAGGERAVLEREPRALEDLVPVVVGHRHFGRGDQVVPPGGLEEVLLEFRQLAGAAHRIGVHQIRRQQLQVAALASGVEEELHHRELQACQRAPIEREACAGHLRGALEVEQTQSLSDLGVLLRRRNLRLVAPGPDHLIVALGRADGDRLVRQIGNVEQGLLDPLLDRLETRFLLLHVVRERLQALAKLHLLLALERPHLLRRLALLRPLRLARLDQLAPLGGQRLDGSQRFRRRSAARRESAPRLVQIRHHPSQVEHGVGN